ncbi:BaiN/RdsA family NAD(P)/FAD-dependent oxidoreductase [Hippea jasoniae]|uniref:NAD(P)/FAD-dependent oxidoreductase n=1 Tax=Hippea jasoniae TaxID=944479 RepID=UPI000552BBE5|nr:aminoacetone oxidase family FAD-binding enzyme [Hippea jasoniae]
MYDVAIVGGGASGLFCALNLKKGLNVVVFDKKSGAKKLALTGKNRCNITSTRELEDFLLSYRNGKFLRDAFGVFFKEQLIEWLKKHGISVEIEKEKVRLGNISSEEFAKLLLKLTKKQCCFHPFEPVVDIEKRDDFYILKTTKGIYRSKSVVIATGGASYPSTGSDGNGFKLAQKLSHRIEELEAAEVAFCAEGVRRFQGLSFDNILAVLKIGSKTIKRRGDLIFTHFGVSGPVIFELSAESFRNGILVLNFIDMQRDDFVRKLRSFRGKLKNFLAEFTPKRFASYAPSGNKLCRELGKSELNKVWNYVSAFELNIKKCPIEMAFVTRGGVSVKEINPKTFESKLHKNLFFCGEVVDIDGPIGGFNLQYAFSSGYLVAKTLNERL